MWYYHCLGFTFCDNSIDFLSKYSPLYVFLFIFHLNILGGISCFLFLNCLLSSVYIWGKWYEVFWLVMEVVSFWWMPSWKCSFFLCHAKYKIFIVLLFSFSVVSVLGLHCWSSLLYHLYWWGYCHRWSSVNLKYATFFFLLLYLENVIEFKLL